MRGRFFNFEDAGGCGRRCGCGRDRPGPGVTLLGYRCVYLLMKISLNLGERLLEDAYGYAV